MFQKNKNEIIVYTCIFGGYEEIKPIKFKNNEIRYILFTDNKNYSSESWEVILVNKSNLDPRRLSRLPKILAHKYLPKHDISIYIDASFELIFHDINTMILQCLGESDIALWHHHARKCSYDEMEFCLASSERPVNRELTLKQIDRYENSGFPRAYGLFENGIIFRRNTTKIAELNELWWKEYSTGAERDQFSLMFCLYYLNISPNPILIGSQIRKNPYVKFHKHNYKTYVDSNTSCCQAEFYIVFMDKFHNWGTTRLRGSQIYEAIKDSVSVALVPYSKALSLHGKNILFLKIQDYDFLLPLLDNNNKIYLDMVDCQAKYIHGKESIFKKVEFGIFTSNRARDHYASLFKNPEKCLTIYHHWDVTLQNFINKETQSVGANFGYFGVREKGFLFDELPDIDFFEVTSTNFDDQMKSKMAEYNVQYVIRPQQKQDEFPALTKVSTSACLGSIVITTKNDDAELLGEDYPYYAHSMDRDSIYRVVSKIRKTFGDQEWELAKKIMADVKEKTSLNNIKIDYIKFINSLPKVPNMLDFSVGRKKAFYTANIGSYDQPKPLDKKYIEGWDAFYFTDMDDVEIPGWICINVKDELTKFPSALACARNIKTSPDKYLAGYDITVWADSTFILTASLNNFLMEIPDSDFITVRHPKRTNVNQELEQPRVRASTSEARINLVRSFYNTRKYFHSSGLQETNIVIRKNNSTVTRLNTTWWQLMRNFRFFRDQVFLTLAAHENNFEISLISHKTRNRYFNYVDHPRRFINRSKFALKIDQDRNQFASLDLQKTKLIYADFTLCFFLKIESWGADWRNIVSIESGGKLRIAFRVKNGKVGQFVVFDKQQAPRAYEFKINKIRLGMWENITLVSQNSSFVALYINGHLECTHDLTGLSDLESKGISVFILNNSKRTQGQSGYICDIQLFSEAKDDLEVYKINDGKNPELDHSLIAKFDFCSAVKIGSLIIDNHVHLLTDGIFESISIIN